MKTVRYLEKKALAIKVQPKLIAGGVGYFGIVATVFAIVMTII